jgi:hypothetical protein
LISVVSELESDFAFSAASLKRKLQSSFKSIPVPFKLLGKPVDYYLIKIVPTKMSVTIGRFDFKHSIPQALLWKYQIFHLPDHKLQLFSPFYQVRRLSCGLSAR